MRLLTNNIDIIVFCFVFYIKSDKNKRLTYSQKCIIKDIKTLFLTRR